MTEKLTVQREYVNAEDGITITVTRGQREFITRFEIGMALRIAQVIRVMAKMPGFPAMTVDGELESTEKKP